VRRPEDRPSGWTARDRSQQWLLAGSISAQVGMARGPLLRPTGWLLGRGPRCPCGGRPRAVFTSTPNTQLNSTPCDLFCLFFKSTFE
jgi:hypothetical protein